MIDLANIEYTSFAIYPYFIQKRYKDDRNFILEFIKKDGLLLRYAMKDIQNDFEIVFMAISQNSRSYEFASERLKNTDKIIRKALDCPRNNVLEFSMDFLRDNEEIVMKSVMHCGNTLRFASERLKNNFNVVMTAVQQNGFALKYAPRNIRFNFDICQAALKQNKNAAKYIPENMFIHGILSNEFNKFGNFSWSTNKCN
jgi:hypothetical protein